ncbi:(2Fe-2S)-binding protein [Candidatus Uabimicrobium sp. HlEnr_7]|uniref:(2Fe-2S)-binding protein n=1 Tax=Candidatus Uabimicrobium helgolandensis TaxID=3095367 RepID=UPI0035577CAD
MSQNRKESEDTPDISRRSFLKGVGIASIGVAVGSGITSEGVEGHSASEVLGPNKNKFSLSINGKDISVEAEPRQTLAEILRDHLQMTGTKTACERGACGACTVVMNGNTVPSCMTLAVDAIGAELETIEGLEKEGELHPIQQSFVDHDALQCGFCTPGMIMSCKNLLDQNPSPNLEEIKLAVSGNLCRCGTYPKVFEAVSALKNKGE